MLVILDELVPFLLALKLLVLDRRAHRVDGLSPEILLHARLRFLHNLPVYLVYQVLFYILNFDLGTLYLLQRISFVQKLRFLYQLVLLELLEILFYDILIFVSQGH